MEGVGKIDIENQDDKSSRFTDRFKKWLSSICSNNSGILLSIASGFLLTMYSTIFKSIKEDIDKSVVLILRGLLQVSLIL